MKTGKILLGLLASCATAAAHVLVQGDNEALQAPLSGPSIRADHKYLPELESHKKKKNPDGFDPESALFTLHRELTQTESITFNEGAVGHFLAQSLRKSGFTVETQHISQPPDSPKKGPRYNIYAYPSQQRNPAVLLSSHIDTVPPFYAYRAERDPHSGNTTLHGRGIVDAKASVSAQVTAVRELLAAKAIAPEDVGLLFVVGEEVGGDGMDAASAHLNVTPQAVIFGEPTEGRLCAGHKGQIAATLRVQGKAAHSGYPWLGVSANELLVTALAAVMAQNERFPSSDKFGRTTVNLGTLAGGVASNVVAETALARVTLRIAGGRVADVRRTLREIVAESTSGIIEDARKRGIDVGGIGVDVSFLTEGYAPVDLSTDIDGFGEPITVNYGTDVPNWKGSGKRYLYGPGSILVAHSDHEELAAGDLLKAVEDYKRMVVAVLGTLKRGEEDGF